MKVLDTSLEYKGKFWVSGNYKNRKNGILKFKEEIAYIDLFDSFDEPPFHQNFREKMCCIQGLLDNYQYCVFNDCSLGLSHGAFASTLINFELMYYSVNENLVTQNVQFEEMGFELDCLEKWVNHSGFEHFDNENELGVKRVPENLKLVELFSNEDYKIRIHHTSTIPFINPKSEWILTQKTSLVLEIIKDVKVDELFLFVDKIHELFILLMGNKVSLLSNFEVKGSDGKMYNGYKNNTKFSKVNRRGLNSYILSLDEIMKQGDIKDFFYSWMELYKDYEYSIELVVNSLSDDNLNQQNKFINLMYALDVIQQKDLTQEFKEERILSLTDSKIIKKLVEFGVDGNTVNSVKSKLQKKNTPKLKDKIEKLLAPYSTFIESEFNLNFKDFIVLIVNTRNFLAHENNSSPKLNELSDFYIYNNLLVSLLSMIFFSKLNISNDMAESLMRRRTSFVRPNK